MGLATGRDVGYKLQGPVTNLAAAGVANAVVIFQQSTFGQLVGTKSYILKRVKMMNNALGNQVIIIGTGAGAGFAQMLPGLATVNNQNEDFIEDDLPEVEFFADMTAYPVALIAAGTLDIQVEVEERG